MWYACPDICDRYILPLVIGTSCLLWSVLPKQCHQSTVNDMLECPLQVGRFQCTSEMNGAVDIVYYNLRYNLTRTGNHLVNTSKGVVTLVYDNMLAFITVYISLT